MAKSLSYGYKKLLNNGLIKTASSKQNKPVTEYKDYNVERMKKFDPYAAIKKIKEMNANLNEMQIKLDEIKAKYVEKGTTSQSVKSNLTKKCDNDKDCDDLKADGDSTTFLMQKKRKPEQSYIGFYLQIESLSNNFLSERELVSLVIQNCNNSSLQMQLNSRVSISKLELLQKLNQLDGVLISKKIKRRLNHLKQGECKMCDDIGPDCNVSRERETNVDFLSKGRVKKLIMQFELQAKI